MADAHLSIGEVLTLLQDEFPDVTISKIRFLESQGLIDPERTPSGYRKFYEADIERLRWILVQQRENFLPLKVIRERLVGGDEPIEWNPTTGTHPTVDPTAAPPAAGPPRLVSVPTPGAEPRPTVRTSLPAGELDPPPPGRTPREVERSTEPIWMADLAASRGARAEPVVASRPLAGQPLDTTPAADTRLTAGELVDAAGITFEALRELEQFGLVAGRPYSDDVYYDADAVLIATRAAGFLAHGVGARHLRMFKVSAEREAGFLEQIAMPMLKQRNPEARRQAVDLVEELAALGHDLRAALLRANLRRHLDRS